MRVQIEVQGDSDGADLLRWLKRDPAGAHATFSTPPAEAEDSDMGAAEIIQAVVDNSTALGGLVIATAAWLDSRRATRAAQANAPTQPQAQVTIECDGAVVTVLNGDPAEIQRIIAVLSRAEDPDGGGSAASP
ncbi:effector-associated constant component EACC1 [Streptomyces sp. NPDC054874]